MRVVKKGNKNTKILAYKSLVWPILEYGAACWDPYSVGQIKALEGVQKRAAKFAHHEGDTDWETWLSAGGRLIYVHFTRHTMGRGHGKIYGIGLILQVT